MLFSSHTGIYIYTENIKVMYIVYVMNFHYACNVSFCVVRLSAVLLLLFFSFASEQEGIKFKLQFLCE